VNNNIDIFNTEQEAIDDGCLWGVDLIYLTEEHISLLKAGKVLKTDNGEYVQIMRLKGE
jgi:hypothetical protein